MSQSTVCSIRECLDGAKAKGLCESHYGKARYKAKRETFLAYAAKYREGNREEIRARNADQYVKNRDARMAYSSSKRREPEYSAAARARTLEWREANPERAKQYAESYRERYPERVAANLRRWHEANPDKVRVHRSVRKDRVRNSGRIDFTADQLTARLAVFGHACWMCGGPYEHLDHVKPVSKGGITALANLRPSCARCNLSKKDKWFGAAQLHRFIRV